MYGKERGRGRYPCFASASTSWCTARFEAQRISAVRLRRGRRLLVLLLFDGFAAVRRDRSGGGNGLEESGRGKALARGGSAESRSTSQVSQRVVLKGMVYGVLCVERWMLGAGFARGTLLFFILPILLYEVRDLSQHPKCFRFPAIKSTNLQGC